MTVFIFWILLAVAVGMLASKRGRSGFGWFLLSALLSPLLGFIFVLVAKDLSQSTPSQAIIGPSVDTHVKCPHCAEWVLPEASVCKHCGGALTPKPNFHTDRAKIAAAAKKEDETNLAIGVAAVFGLIVFAGMLSTCSG